MSTISVVIPARNSQSSIRITVESLWNQTLLPGEVLIVVGPDDYTKTAIQDFISSGFVTIITVNPPEDYVRDAMWKRRVGVEAAKGDVIVFIDSKSIAEKHAIENILNMITVYKASAVAGITPAWPMQKQNFWAKLHDKALISNLPNFPKIGWITKENFAKSESLPLTSAFAITRKVFDLISDDFAVEFSKYGASYEDYVLSWLIVEKDIPILVTNQFVAYHKHRLSWKEYSKQISRSGQGAAVMVKMYPKCPFAERRLRQVQLITVAVSVCTLLTFLAVVLFKEMAIGIGVALAAAIYACAGFLNAIKAKDWQAFAFPFFTVLLILTFALHFIKTYNQTEFCSCGVSEYLQIH